MKVETWRRRWIGMIWVLGLCGAGAAPVRAEQRAPAAPRPGRPSKAQPAAKADSWLFVPVLASPLPANVSVSQLSAAFEAELRSAGMDVVANTDAAHSFESRHSSEPVRLDSDEMTRLLRSVSQAARHLALGDLPQAQQAMEGVYALSGPARDYLNREAARARKIFDTCLMTAYLWERDHQSAQALRQMLECSRSFPGFRPEGRAYPPELREVFEQARQQLNQLPATTLYVTSKQERSCGVRLNGIELGKSPMSFSDVRAGITRVQLECEPGAPGRIHSVELKAGDNKLTIDSAFDAAVHSDGALWLKYHDEAERGRRADADSETIRQVMGATRTVQLLVDGATYPRVRVRVVFDTPRELATLSYNSGEGYNHEGVVTAVKALQSAARPQPTAAVAGAETGPVELDNEPDEAPPEEPPPPPPAAPAAQLDEQALLPGIVLAAVGVGGIATSWVLYAQRQNVRRTPYPDSEEIPTEEVTAYNNSGIVVLAIGGASSLVLSLSDYFWLPNDPGVPALAWVAGGVGTAVALTGLGFAVFGTHCDRYSATLDSPRVCQGFTADYTFGPLLAMQGLPLLAIPISYALRAAFRPSGVDVSLRVGAVLASSNAQGVTVEGVF
jgi:hypothetical protein